MLFFVFCAVLVGLAQEHMGKGRINGTVVDEKGQPLEGVLIVAESLEYETKLQGYSDKKGRFAVAGMGTGNWRITATKKGYISSYITKYVRQLRKSPPSPLSLRN